MPSSPSVTGGCPFGTVRYCISHALMFAGYSHNMPRRKVAGAPVVAFAGVVGKGF